MLRSGKAESGKTRKRRALAAKPLLFGLYRTAATDLVASVPGKIFDIKAICLLFLAFVALMVVLQATRDILVPFVIAVFLYLAVSPMINWFKKSLRLPHIVSMSLTLFTAMLLAGLLVFLVFVSLTTAFRGLEQYQHHIVSLSAKLIELFNSWLSPLQISIDPATVTANLKKLPVLAWARTVSSELIDFLGQTVLVALFFIFLIAGTNVKRRAIDPPGSMAFEMHDKIARYLGVKFMTSLVTGLITGLILVFLGLDLAMLFGLLTFFLNFIPSIGSIVATLLPLPVAFLQFGPGAHLVLVVALPGMVQFTIGNLIEPRIMGDSLGLHPVVVLLALLLWGYLWGVAGMLLAVPITAVLKILMQKYEITQPIARVLEGEVS